MKTHSTYQLVYPWTVMVAVLCAVQFQSKANPKIRDTFFDHYTNISSSDTVYAISGVNKTPHCGMCHYNFTGGGDPWNPYGLAVRAQLETNGNDKVASFIAVESLDSDGDGYSNIDEIMNSLINPYKPTFPGLNGTNVSQVVNVNQADIIDYLTPTSGGPDTTDPVVSVLSPNGGETTDGDAPMVISWSATDDHGISSINIYVSDDHGATFTPIALSISSTPSTFTWYVPNRPTSNALIKIEAIDTSLNDADDTSDSVFVINSFNGFPYPTLRDFDQPGSQPIVDSGSPQTVPSSCANCHGGYDETNEPYRNWLGSMMAHASFDPIFKANMSIAQQDVPDSGDLCLRCHNSRGWLDGRSTPTDGSQMTAADMFGVSCDLCHRMVDPAYEAGVSPAEDDDILATLANIPASENGNGMYVFDPNADRRGPFDDTISPHTALYSPFHRKAELCGTCHNVSNPAFERDGTNAEYVANSFGAPATNFSPEVLMPVERTYSEWLHSDYNTTNGVFAPQFAGNKNGGMVATCQDCHLPDIPGYGANTNLYPVALRANLPLHDMTGGSSWLLRLMPDLTNSPYAPGSPEATAISNGAYRAEYMLQKAARMQAEQVGDQLKVLVINDTGHKLPSGYPEGRRIWINVRFYDASDQLIEELGGYNYSNAVLTATNTTVYQIHPGIGPALASTLGMDAGPSLHFVLNNQIYEDNRIPPRGFTNAEFDAFGGAPVGHHYEDRQYWDETFYDMPSGAVRAHVRLYYQSTSKEFIEFLRDENNTDSNGQEMYDLWVDNDMCPPVQMTEAFWPENFTLKAPSWLVGNKIGLPFNSVSGYTYRIEYTDQLDSNNVLWKSFLSNGMLEAIGSESIFTDDFTTATSGGGATNGYRFYRILR